MKVKYCFEPEYLKYSDEHFFDISLHDFQLKIRDVSDSKIDCLFVNASTGTGKTLAFGLPTFRKINVFQRPRTLIISPTNLLIDQIFKDLNESVAKYPEIGNVKIKKLTGIELTEHFAISRRQEIMNSFKQNEIVVSNPDIISLLLSGFYLTNAKLNPTIKTDRMRNPEDIFSRLDVIIFDEYHVYSEEEIGKIISFIILTRLTGIRIKMVFSSATPNEKLIKILEQLGLECESVNVKTSNIEEKNSRTVRGEILLYFSDKNIFNQLKGTDLSEKIRRLYLFDHKIDAERSINFLLKSGVREEEIQELTGWMQRSRPQKKYTNKEDFVIATNAAEQGLNLEGVEKAHIEPGLFLENLSQRLGRIGRSGSSGEVTVHVNKDIIKNLPETAQSYDELLESLKIIFRTRESYSSRIKNHYAAFMSLCALRSVRPELKRQITDLLEARSDNGIRDVFHALLNFNNIIELLKKTGKRRDMREINELNDWWEQFLSALGYFRGQSNTVIVKILRSDGNFIISSEDLKWVKKWCRYATPKENEKEFLITGFNDIPSTVDMKYAVPCGTFTVSTLEFNNRETFRRKLIYAFNDFVDVLLSEDGDVQDGLKSTFERFSKVVYPDMLMPKEVIDSCENQIL